MLPAFGRLRQVDHEFKHSLGYTAKLSLKKTKQKKKKWWQFLYIPGVYQ
jgi:hypothetical protein